MCISLWLDISRNARRYVALLRLLRVVPVPDSVSQFPVLHLHPTCGLQWHAFDLESPCMFCEVFHLLSADRWIVATYELPSALKCRAGGEMLESPSQLLHPRQESCLESLTSSLPSAFGVQSQKMLVGSPPCSVSTCILGLLVH